MSAYGHAPQIALLEGSNFVDRPIGGQLTKIKAYIEALPYQCICIGMTDERCRVGAWSEVSHKDKTLPFFGVGVVSATEKRPVIPQRAQFLAGVLKWRRVLRRAPVRLAIAISPEGAFAANLLGWHLVMYESSGVCGSLRKSRYQWARPFASLFEEYTYRVLRETRVILAAADMASIEEWVSNSDGSIKREYVHQLPTGFDEEIFYVREKVTCRREKGLPVDARIVTWVGRLNRVKNWSLAITAFAVAAEKCPRLIMLMVGDGEDREDVVRKCKELNVDHKVVMLGSCSRREVAMALGSSDVIVSTSEMEGWPTSVVEGLACGRPVVSSAVGGAIEMIKNEENGFLCRTFEVKEYANAIARALSLEWDEERCAGSVAAFGSRERAARLRELLGRELH